MLSQSFSSSRQSRLKSASSSHDENQSNLFETILGKSTESLNAQKPLYSSDPDNNDVTRMNKHPLFGSRSDRHDSYVSDKSSASLQSGKVIYYPRLSFILSINMILIAFQIKAMDLPLLN